MLQCLAQTPFLRKCLLDISESGEPITMQLDNEEIVSISSKNGSLNTFFIKLKMYFDCEQVNILI